MGEGQSFVCVCECVSMCICVLDQSLSLSSDLSLWGSWNPQAPNLHAAEET